jgi:hypothetical protein
MSTGTYPGTFLENYSWNVLTDVYGDLIKVSTAATTSEGAACRSTPNSCRRPPSTTGC